MQTKREVVFGELRFDYANGRVWQREKEVHLRPKAFAVLRYLATHRGRLVPRDELLKEVWPETRVSESVLRVCVREIRSALGDDPRSPKVIETVGKRGYRCLDEEGRPPVVAPKDRFVGRRMELEALMGCLADVRKGAQRLVFVSGEAGIGKTTLVDRFIEQVEAEGAVRIGRGQCLEQYGEGEAYLPVLEALGELCRHPQKGPRVRETLGHHAPSWLVHMPGVLSDRELQALALRAQGTTHERSLRELGDALDALSREDKVVLVFEDLHWSDHSTLELVLYLGRRPQNPRLLWVGTYRPEEADRGSAPLLSAKRELLAHEQCEELELGLLSRNDVADYLARRLGAPFAPELSSLVHRRTEGNALFMVHLVDYLLSEELLTNHRDGFQIQAEQAARIVPENLRQLIEKQLERLSESQRQVLEVASVVGVEFAVTSVAGALSEGAEDIEQTCLGLSRAGQMVEEREVVQWPDGTLSGRYGFTHALCQEVLYERVSKARRIVLHRRIGERLEASFGDRASDISAELAVHFERGHDRLKAVHYLHLAANAAIRRSAHLEAVEHLRHALSLLQELPDNAERAQQELVLQAALGVQLTVTQGYAAAEVERAYARAHALSQQTEPDPRIFPALFGLSIFYTARGDYRPALELGRGLRDLADLTRDPVFSMQAGMCLGTPLVYLGRPAEGQRELEGGIKLYEFEQHRGLLLEYSQDPSVACRTHLTWARWLLGYPDHALQIALDALRHAERLRHPFSCAAALHFLALVNEFRGDYRATIAIAEREMRLSEEHQFVFWGALSGLVMAGGLLGLGEAERASELLREGLAAYAQIGALTGATYWRCQLAEACGAVGRFDEGLAVIAEAIRDADAREERWWEAELYRQKGELLCAAATGNGSADDREAGIDSLTQALEIAKRQGAVSLELRAAMSLARRAQNLPRVRTLYEQFTEGFETADLREAKALLGESPSGIGASAEGE